MNYSEIQKNDPLSSAWKSIHEAGKIQGNTSEKLQKLQEAGDQIDIFTKKAFDQGKFGKKEDIGRLNNILFKIYEIERQEKTKPIKDRNKDAMDKLDNCLKRIVDVISPSELPKDAKPKVVSGVFNIVMDLIHYDAHEEVVGQERPIGAIPAQVVKLMQEKTNTELSSKNKNMIKQLAAQLYPIALLSITMDPTTKIPDKNIEMDRLFRTAHNF